MHSFPRHVNFPRPVHYNTISLSTFLGSDSLLLNTQRTFPGQVFHPSILSSQASPLQARVRGEGRHQKASLLSL